MSTGRRLNWLSICGAVVLGLGISTLGCVNTGVDDGASVDEGQGVGVVTQAIRSGETVNVSGAIVQIWLPQASKPGFFHVCTATMINENALITAAHCGDQANSYYDTVKALYQENASTWRCLTNLDASGAVIRGQYNDVVGACTGTRAGFGSYFDNGSDWQDYPGNDPGEVWRARKNDFAVIKIWDAGFRWIGVPREEFAAIYDDVISNGKEWVYGAGLVAPNRVEPAIRRARFDVVYHDNDILGAFGDDSQTCSGDSGGPMGVFLPGSNRFAVVAVTASAPEHTTPTPLSPRQDTICQSEGGAAYWTNAVTKISYIETAIGKTCRSASHQGISAKECWD